MELQFIIHQPSRSLGSNPVSLSKKRKKLGAGVTGAKERQLCLIFFRLSCKVALKFSLLEGKRFSECLIKRQALKGRGRFEV